MSIKRVIPKTEFHNIFVGDDNISYTDNPAQILPKIYNYKVYKHNNLIQSKSNFTAMEHRIIVLAIAQITPQDKNLKMYRINIQDVLGKKSNTSNYDTVRKAVKRLHKCSIDMEEGKKWRSYSFITMAEGEYGKNFIEIQFHKDIQKFLLGLKSQYTSYTLDNVMKFKKSYSLRIYEFCKQYLSIGDRVMKIDYLRQLLSLEKKYLEFYNFRDRVLKPALEEINEFSDIQVKCVERKEGKSVDSIRFIIYRKKGIPLQKARTLTEQMVEFDNMKKLQSLGFDYEEMDLMRQKNTENKISAVLALYEKHIDEVKFPKPWIQNALKENFVDSSVYKRQLKARTEGIALMRAKDREIVQKKQQIKEIKEGIVILNKDIKFYQENGKLKPGDVMRFPSDYTVNQAINDLNIRIKTGESAIENLVREIEILAIEANNLK